MRFASEFLEKVRSGRKLSLIEKMKARFKGAQDAQSVSRRKLLFQKFGNKKNFLARIKERIK